MPYASKKTFGGQRASTGRIVLIRGRDHDENATDIPLVIVEIGDDDGVYVRNLDPQSVNEMLETIGPIGSEYYDAKTEGDLAGMPLGSWCWPPPV